MSYLASALWKHNVVKAQALKSETGSLGRIWFSLFSAQKCKNSTQGLSHGAGRSQAKHPASSRKMKTDEEGKQV